MSGLFHSFMATIERASLFSKIKDLEDELKKTKYNKKSQGHIGLVKAKIARLKDEEQRRASSKGKTEGFSVRRTGDATIIMVGFPSVGKSTLLNAITNAHSEVAAYAFTTLTCIPGLMEYKHANIQVLDVPGIVEGAASGRGRGKEVLACAQSADLVLILIDVFKPGNVETIKKEIYETNLRISQEKPDVTITKKPRGGIDIGSTVKLTHLTKEMIADVLREYKLNNCSIVIRDNITVEELCDAIENNKKYIPAIVVLNKIDMVSLAELERIKSQVKPDICISADQQTNLEELRQLIFQKLNFIRVFCKEAGKKADLEVPLIMKQPATVQDVCQKLHKDFIAKFRFARIWGSSAKFPGQKHGLAHKLADEDIVEIHVK